MRQKYGYDLNKFTVLGSGQIQTRKGVLDFVKLANQNPDVQFIWTGGFSFGKITEGYAELEKSLVIRLRIYHSLGLFHEMKWWNITI
ncbi:glycosyltransferase LafB [Lentilactobacillus kosonis]|uniref:Glycosyltransferase LafB n=1 Tax=Lentilactobacillus kosonis TaxID=2810561 RepID=A0A401FPU1_9LACO|nr:glycosyltransferase LafB [Lentilactobacillus kosonis]